MIDEDYILNESILDNISSDDMSSRQSSATLATAENVNVLPSPWDACYRYLFKVGCGFLFEEQNEETTKILEYKKNAIFDVLEGTRSVRKYSDIEFEFDTSNTGYLVFCFDANFKKPSNILHFINNLYVISAKINPTHNPYIQTAIWIKYVEYDKDESMYNPEYVSTFKECQLLNRRLERKRMSGSTFDAFSELHSFVCTMMGGSPLTFTEFCNFIITYEGSYDVYRVVLYMLNGTIRSLSQIYLPIIAKKEVNDKTVDFKNLVLRWTKYTRVFRIPAISESSEYVPELMPVRGDCKDHAIRDEICNILENDKKLQIRQIYIITHYAVIGGSGECVSVICQVYTEDSNYYTGFVVTMALDNNNKDARKIATQILAGILREGLSMDSKEQIERGTLVK